uniref:Zinc finger, CCHC-type n=1 Tax=Tanacetum cinerariifolium TaxID=118510 RepID=A0A6L2JNT3_TANCI|nr:zinc finger, CCHC-type [Tanacetum cinerariifolium]
MAATAMKHMASNFAKVDKFKGVDFRRWQKKKHFLLSSMSVVYVLTKLIPKDGGDDATMEQIRKRAKWDNDDYVCRGLILNDFKHALKHLKEELTLVELGNHLRIEESLRVQDSDKPKGNNVAGPSVVNMVEHNNSTRISNKRNKITLYELWTKRKPNPNYLRVWGCRAVVRLSNPKLKTLGERGIECIFVGYVDHSKAFRFYLIGPNDSVAINSIIESRDAIFDENRFSSVLGPSLRIPNETEDIGGSVVLREVVQQPKIELKKSKNNRNPNNFRPEFQIYLIEGTRDEMDVKTAFLNGELEEEVYMNQPQGFIIHGNENKVCKLIESLYGLKQAPKQWHQKFDEVVLSNGYLLNQADKCVYSKFDETGHGEADVILGIKIKHESNGIKISQCHYIEKVLKKFNYFNWTPVSTPMDTNEKLMPNNGQAVSRLEYSRVIGCLMYAMTCTRHDIAFVVGKLRRYTRNPGTQHWQAILRVLKYLKKTMDYRLTYTGYLSVLEVYTDASWISNTEDNSSTSGWAFLLSGGALSWGSKKQT